MKVEYSSEDYIKDVLVVENVDIEAIEKRLQLPQIYRIMHAAMGLSTEANELIDMLECAYGDEKLDFVNIEEELGDSNWYQSEMIDIMRQFGYNISWEITRKYSCNIGVSLLTEKRSSLTDRIMHAAIKMSVEANEILDIVKKYIYYGRKMNLLNIKERLCNSNICQTIIIDTMKQLHYNTSWEIINKKNIDKLRKRYKSGTFTAVEAVNRNLDVERAVLEDNCYTRK